MGGADDLFGDGEGAPSGFFGDVARAGEKRHGRPPGARNRHSADFEKLYYALGFEDPLLFLGRVIQADPRDLAKLTGGKSGDMLALQVKAAGDLAPYLHGKKPNVLELRDERLPTLIIVANSDQLAEAQQLLEERKALSAGSPMIEGETVEKSTASEGGE